MAAEEEWELCNDDGFIYKRRKRTRTDSSSAQPPPADPDAELRSNRLARRKRSLLVLRDRYRREIDQWEGLLASLHDAGPGGTGGGALLPLAAEEPPRHHGGGAAGAASSSCGHQESDEIAARENPCHTLVEELVLQVEAQESILKKLSNICDIVDSACDMREETMMESLLDLPVWGSPRALMSSLLD